MLSVHAIHGFQKGFKKKKTLIGHVNKTHF